MKNDQASRIVAGFEHGQSESYGRAKSPRQPQGHPHAQGAKPSLFVLCGEAEWDVFYMKMKQLSRAVRETPSQSSRSGCKKSFKIDGMGQDVESQ